MNIDARYAQSDSDVPAGIRMLVVEPSRGSESTLHACVARGLSGVDARFAWSAEEAVRSVETFACNVAIIDAEVTDDPPTLVRTLQDLRPGLNVVFVGRQLEDFVSVFDLHCSGHVLKPVTESALRHELRNLRYDIGEDQSGGENDAGPCMRFHARCFGNFEFFCDGKPLHTKRFKSKELLAYLISQRGSLCTVGEVEAALWELEPYRSTNQSYLRHLVSDLSTSLRSCGGSDVLVRKRGYLGVNPTKFECDYYDYLENKPGAPQFMGQFMSQYTWAEHIRGGLLHR